MGNGVALWLYAKLGGQRLLSTSTVSVLHGRYGDAEGLDVINDGPNRPKWLFTIQEAVDKQLAVGFKDNITKFTFTSLRVRASASNGSTFNTVTNKTVP
ncbi:hypothetical protein PanWU01x14_098880 [Parasponia andersonii]|uniref:Uncharacterized protein n=1 Tax=Parasponia andersonii TaxID=3476 RepID=A0A2P5D447_PARAD|nr:hypothetical protein PanWU01x14_098880 [Parasponia andersonii]